MATSAVQGFLKSANLLENTQDRQLLNNLATAPIADDISLFINNSQNVSRLTIADAEYNFITGLVTLVNNTPQQQADRSAVFTNGDPVRILYTNETILQANLFVTQSDGEKTFGFASDVDGEEQFTFDPPSEGFIVERSDAVILNNLTFLGPVETTAGFSSGLTGADSADPDSGSSIEPEDTYANQFLEIYQYLDISKYQADKKFVSDRDVATDDDFRMEGTFSINDPADMIITEGINVNSPGLYITNPSSPVSNIQRIRAFSDTSNPWEVTGSGVNTKLTTNAVTAQTGDLKLNNGILIDGITPITESGNVNNVTFTHKAKVKIDGIDYFLCLTS